MKYILVGLLACYVIALVVIQIKAAIIWERMGNSKKRIETMNYKIGDKVRIKSLDWYYNNRDRIDEVACGNTNFIPDMVKYCEGIVTISSILPTLKVYHIKEDGGMFNWTDEMIEGLVEEEVPLNIDDFQDDDEIIDIIDEYVHRLKDNECQIDLPEGYQFVDENGNVINARKIVLEKEKKKYPKTYEECYKIMGVKLSDCYIQGYKSPLLEDLQELLICRDAYWKIAGEEMGLGKPWEPTNGKGEKVYSIVRECGTIKKNSICDFSNCYILEFPTKEMRDAFYENFKELIEQCKELL